nr:immunoglobulin light chain junction region [Macaca mulatta]MOX80599.1 immunoglobulin light chain junction region [Macaca mulatta]MOX82215.1 immunoglobulin light chain junction region [Macaca mulatta]MOX82369.1 immunoglobulin light chain junction region [Macaca mulatta]MOX83650.1 immunoglobulin light chain junction region [Macaca mulatta]
DYYCGAWDTSLSALLF